MPQADQLALIFLNGITFSMLLYLLAAGLVLMLGVMNIINLAHGSLYMVGAYFAAAAAQAADSFWIGLGAGVAGAGAGVSDGPGVGGGAACSSPPARPSIRRLGVTALFVLAILFGSFGGGPPLAFGGR